MVVHHQGCFVSKLPLSRKQLSGYRMKTTLKSDKNNPDPKLKVFIHLKYSDRSSINPI